MVAFAPLTRSELEKRIKELEELVLLWKGRANLMRSLLDMSQEALKILLTDQGVDIEAICREAWEKTHNEEDNE